MIKFKIEGNEFQINDYISIKDYVKIYKVKDLFKEDYFAAKLLNIVTDAPIELLLESEYDEINYLASYVVSLLPQGEPEFTDRFILDGVEYGFLPNWRDLTFAEFVDLDTICSKKDNELLDLLHVLAAIMYRPIISETSKHNYKIEEYDVDKLKIRSELFNNKLDVSYLIGAQFFFINYANKLYNHTLPFSMKKLSFWNQMKMIWLMWRMIFKITSKKPLGGFWSSTKLLTTILQNTTTSTRKI